MVTDEVRRVLRDDHAFAEMPIGKRANGVDDGGIGFRRWNHLQEPEVARRIEEVRAQPVPAEIVAAALCQHRDRNPRRVRADDRSRRANGLDACKQLLLDVEPLDDRLDDPVSLAEQRHAVVEAGRCHQAMRVRRELRIGLQTPGLLEAFPGDLRREVEQHGGDAGVRAVQRDLCAHRPGAEDGYGANLHLAIW